MKSYMTSNVIVAAWPDEYVSGAKRANLNRSDWLGDWFVGYGKDESCQFEGTWWDMICFARNVLASENTRLAAPEFYKPEWKTGIIAARINHIILKMKIELKNGNSVISVDTPGRTIRGKPKSFDQMKWVLGDMYNGLYWYQKLFLWTLYNIPDTYLRIYFGRRYYK